METKWHLGCDVNCAVDICKWKNDCTDETCWQECANNWATYCNTILLEGLNGTFWDGNWNNDSHENFPTSCMSTWPESSLLQFGRTQFTVGLKMGFVQVKSPLQSRILIAGKIQQTILTKQGHVKVSNWTHFTHKQALVPVTMVESGHVGGSTSRNSHWGIHRQGDFRINTNEQLKFLVNGEPSCEDVKCLPVENADNYEASWIIHCHGFPIQELLDQGSRYTFAHQQACESEVNDRHGWLSLSKFSCCRLAGDMTLLGSFSSKIKAKNELDDSAHLVGHHQDHLMLVNGSQSVSNTLTKAMIGQDGDMTLLSETQVRLTVQEDLVTTRGSLLAAQLQIGDTNSTSLSASNAHLKADGTMRVTGDMDMVSASLNVKASKENNLITIKGSIPSINFCWGANKASISGSITINGQVKVGGKLKANGLVSDSQSSRGLSLSAQNGILDLRSVETLFVTVGTSTSGDRIIENLHLPGCDSSQILVVKPDTNTDAPTEAALKIAPGQIQNCPGGLEWPHKEVFAQLSCIGGSFFHLSSSNNQAVCIQ